MNFNPLAILIGAILLATAAGGMFWGLHQRAVVAEMIRSRPLAEASQIRELKDEIEFLQSQLERLREENAALTEALEEQGGASGADTSPESATISPEELAGRVAEIRRLHWMEAPAISAVSRGELKDRLGEKILADFEDGELADMARALTAVGWVFDDFDPAEALVGLQLARQIAVYDPETNSIFYAEDADLSGLVDRNRLAETLIKALLAQHYGLPDSAPLAAKNSDRALAERSLRTGDAEQVKIFLSVLDSAEDSGAPLAAESQDQYFGAPAYLNDRAMFPHLEGAKFAGALMESGGWERVTAAYGRPPQSTAEILHPDLYLADPPLTPVDITLPDFSGSLPAGAEVYWSDVAGELGLRTLFGILLPPLEAGAAAAGWLGDRYAVIRQDPDPESDSIVWATQWQTAEDAAEFKSAAANFLLRRHAVPYQEKFFAANGDFTVDRHDRALRLRGESGDESRRVVLISAATSALAETLSEALSARPADDR